MKVVWTPKARRDRTNVFYYIASDNPRAAVRMDRIFSDAAVRLSEHPNIGKPGRVPGTRELVLHESYLLVYEIKQQTVLLLALVHTARQWPPLLD